MAAPECIVAAPYTLYLAPVGTDFPAIDDDENTFDGDWFRVGDSGAKDYTEDGVTVTHGQSLNYFRGAGATAPRKAFRTEEDLTIALSLADTSPEQYAKLLNDAAIQTTAPSSGVAGEKRFAMWRGLQVAQFALLARGMSPVDNDLASQYEVETAIADGEFAPKYTKGDPAVLAVQFRALDAAGDGTGFGERVDQTAPATS